MIQKSFISYKSLKYSSFNNTKVKVMLKSYHLISIVSFLLIISVISTIKPLNFLLKAGTRECFYDDLNKDGKSPNSFFLFLLLFIQLIIMYINIITYASLSHSFYLFYFNIIMIMIIVFRFNSYC